MYTENAFKFEQVAVGSTKKFLEANPKFKFLIFGLQVLPFFNSPCLTYLVSKTFNIATSHSRKRKAASQHVIDEELTDEQEALIQKVARNATRSKLFRERILSWAREQQFILGL